MRPATSRRAGMALAAAIVAIVVIGALIGGVFFASTQEFRIGRNSLVEQRAFAAAEQGINQVLAAFGPGGAPPPAIADGAVVPVPVTVIGGAGDGATVTLTRLSANAYWASSVGFAGADNAQTSSTRRSNLILRITQPTMNLMGALTTRGDTKIGGSSEISGVNEDPSGWEASCPPPTGNVAGIATDKTTNVTKAGNAVVITGSPEIQERTEAADTNTFFKYGDENWKSLIAMADLRLTSGFNAKPAPVYAADGKCTQTTAAGAPILANWGDVLRNNPVRTCQQYFPVIYAPGDLSLQGGSGQGILLVEGDLKVSGGFEFFGPVIVRGSLTTTGTGAHFNGGVMAANIYLEQNSVLGDATIQYSNCAIQQALQNAGSLRPVANRSWASLY